ncbi:MAG: hypothetical protein RO469_14355 [Thermincola sp.]|nr:hypothetical protein [Thermincola sp.]MDT3703962.1 hypothetical protein [Thermincola sp.]
MSHIPVSPHLAPLLQGVKPYLASDGQVVTDGILSLLQLLTSESGQDAVATMSRMFTPSGSNGKSVTINTVAGPVTFSLNLVFVLFLILILLILSGNLLALSPGMLGGNDSGHEGSTMV